ncbi:O-methyltransferase [Rummeliibacillus sp. NPDC094406]|uniref:O-methyltransferase n=1 Tax=Rummeliibacillus sp. NPDC094406 TaxID=3364511 RepID=UPI00382C5FD5
MIWAFVDDYINKKLIPSDSTLEQVQESNKQAGLPNINVSSTHGKLLYLLAKLKGAKNILEIGTLGGYSSIWMARALSETGKVYTLEFNPDFAKIAEQNIHLAGYQDKVEVIVGKALDTLPILEEKELSFDLIFIDADKVNYPHYLKWSLKLANPGAVIIADNVVRDGNILDVKSNDVHTEGLQQFMDLLVNNPAIDSTAIQTVGIKGYDGFMIGIVK